MRIWRLIIIMLINGLSVSSVAQDKIQLLNGKILRGKLGNEFEDYFDFQYYEKGGKVKSIDLVKYRIFSYTNSAGEETILYKQDTLMGNFFTKNEMKMFVYGQRDAFANYKAAPWFVSGLAIGFTSVILDTYDFRPNGGFFKIDPTIVPIGGIFVYTIGSGLFKPRVRKEYAADVNFLSSEHYIEGFQKIARVKKLKNSLLGSVIGVSTGLIVYSLAK